MKDDYVSNFVARHIDILLAKIVLNWMRRKNKMRTEDNCETLDFEISARIPLQCCFLHSVIYFHVQILRLHSP